MRVTIHRFALVKYAPPLVEIEVACSPGTYVRALAPSLEKNLPGDVNVLPKNLPGAGGRRGASDIFRSRPDGYTIGIFNMPGVLIPRLQGMATEYDLSRVTWLATLGYHP